LRGAEKQDAFITRRGQAAGVPIGPEADENWFDCRLQDEPSFVNRVASA
jgi:hypothetical protein